MGRRALTLAWSALCVVAGVALYARELARSGLPARAGVFELTGLLRAVEVRFDARGVPHVRAENQADLARALGYLHANDRLFQMELGRRVASGRLAEVLGAAALELDVESRTLGLREVAEASVEIASERARAWYAAYAEGVNAWLAQRGSDLPPELRLLQIEPEPWTATDSICFALLMAKDLVDPGEYEVTNAAWAAVVGVEGLADLLGYDEVHAPAGLLERLASIDSRAPGVPDDGESRGYSNNWAVGAGLSSSGAPLLAGDPHLTLRLPAQFYLARLSCPGFEVFGATIPGHPAVVIGRAEHRAWSLTNTGLDVDDLTLEEFDAAGTAVRRPDRWAPVESRTERFAVRGGGAVERVLRRTDRGPLLEAVPGADDVRALPRSLSWVALEPGDSLEPFLALVAEPEPASVRAALGAYVAPAQNLLVAEGSGGLWFTVLGRAPLRRRGDGRLPVVGAADGYGWLGLAPQADNPRLEAGADQALWTANQDVRPVGYTRPFFAHWAPPDRATRIGRVLAERERWSLEEFASLQLDLRSEFADRFVAALGPEDCGADPRLEALLARLQAWDRRLTGPEGAAFALCVQTLLEAVFDEGLELERLGGPDARKLDAALVRLLEGRHGAVWFDRIQTPEVEQRSTVVPAALAHALELGAELFGTDDLDRWRLADLQRLTLRHPLSSLPGLGSLLDRGPFGLDGHGSTIAALWRRWEGDGWAVVGGASLRFLADLADPQATRHVQPGGQSGHPFDPHYDDQLAAWEAGATFVTPWEPPVAPEGDRLTLVPAR